MGNSMVIEFRPHPNPLPQGEGRLRKKTRKQNSLAVARGESFLQYHLTVMHNF